MCLSSDAYFNLIHCVYTTRVWCNVIRILFWPIQILVTSKQLVVIIVTTPPRKCHNDGDGQYNIVRSNTSTTVMDRISPPDSMPYRRWYRYQHHRIEWWPALLVPTSTPDHNLDWRWCLVHHRQMVRPTDAVVSIISAGSSAKPAVVCDRLVQDWTLTWRWW